MIKWTSLILSTLFCINSAAYSEKVFNDCLVIAQKRQNLIRTQARALKNNINSEISNARESNSDLLSAFNATQYLIYAVPAAHTAGQLESMAALLNEPYRLNSTQRDLVVKLCAKKFNVNEYVIGSKPVSQDPFQAKYGTAK